MAQADTNGNVEGNFQVAASGPLEGKVSVEDNIRGPLAEGQRQPWWPEGVNSDAEMEAWRPGQEPAAKPNASDVAKTPEELAAEEAAKKALEGDDAAKAKEDTEKKPDEEGKTPEPLTDDQIKANLEKAGGVYADPRYLPFAIEVERTGALSAESLAKAATDFNVPPEFVKSFIDGQLAQKALAANTANQENSAKENAIGAAILGVFTGDDGATEYEAFVQWGATNLSKAEQTAYDSAMDRGDTTTIGILLGTYKARFQAAEPGTRRDITQTGNAGAGNQEAQGVKPFASLAEGRAAMGSRKYATDAAYRAEVDARYVVTDA